MVLPAHQNSHMSSARSEHAKLITTDGVVDTGIPSFTSPALDIAALCLSSWPAVIFTQTMTSDTPASHYMSADSRLTTVK